MTSCPCLMYRAVPSSLQRHAVDTSSVWQAQWLLDRHSLLNVGKGFGPLLRTFLTFPIMQPTSVTPGSSSWGHFRVWPLGNMGTLPTNLVSSALVTYTR